MPTLHPVWPSTMILVHGYAASPGAKKSAAKGAGHTNDFWYWKGKYSDNKTWFDVPGFLHASAAHDGFSTNVEAANWDGSSTIQSSVHHLIDVLDCYCTGTNTCDLVGHSTGDAIIGYTLDKAATTRPVKHYSASAHACVDTGKHQTGWNLRNVYVAGGAGGGTEAAEAGFVAPYVGLQWLHSWLFGPVAAQLVPATMRALYNHDMHGLYAKVPNVRFVGAGTGFDWANHIPYPAVAPGLRGRSDGLVPFHSQGGVKPFTAEILGPSYDSYCVSKWSSSAPPWGGCGELNLGSAAAEQWVGWKKYKPAPLFAGYRIAMIDNAFKYNHTDEVGRVAEWIARYKRNPTPWYSSTTP